MAGLMAVKIKFRSDPNADSGYRIKIQSENLFTVKGTEVNRTE